MQIQKKTLKMLAKDISIDIPCLKPEDTVRSAKDILTEYCVCDICIVNKGKLVGVIPQEVITQVRNQNVKLKTLKEDILIFNVNENQHILDVLYVAGEFKRSVIPLTDENNLFKGVITTQTLLKNIADLFTFSDPGGIITLEVDNRDYQLSQIAQIVEENNAKVISLITSLAYNSPKTIVTLKINRKDLTHIKESFERYGYNTTLYYSELFAYDQIKERYNHLMKYLDM